MSTATLVTPPPVVTPPPGRPDGRKPGPGAAWLVWVGIVVGVVLIAYAGFELVNLAGTRTYRSSHQFPITHRLVLDAGEGSITVVPDATDRIVVDQTVRCGLHPAIATATRGGDGAVHIRTNCGGFLSVNCSIQTTVHVPAATDITGSMGDGSLTANGLLGTVHVQNGDGSVTMRGHVGNVWLETGDGRVDLRGLTATTVEVRAGDGSVVLGFARPPTSAVVHTGDGSVELAVPGGTAYAVSTTSGNGGVDNQVATDPGAPHHLTVATGDGSIAIHLGEPNH